MSPLFVVWMVIVLAFTLVVGRYFIRSVRKYCSKLEDERFQKRLQDVITRAHKNQGPLPSRVRRGK